MTDQTRPEWAKADADVYDQFTVGELDKIDDWAHRDGVPLRELPERFHEAVRTRRQRIEDEAEAADVPIAYRGAVERRRDELAAQREDDDEPLERWAARLNVTELITAAESEILSVAHVSAAIQALRDLAAQRDFPAGEEALMADAEKAEAFVRELDAKAASDDDPVGELEGPPIGGALRQDLAAVDALERALKRYQARRRRLEALEVKDTRDAKIAKLELDLGEANDFVDEVAVILGAL